MIASHAANKATFKVTTPSDREIRLTRLTATCLYPSQEIRDMVVGSGMERGAGLSYDRLDDLVVELQQS